MKKSIVVFMLAGMFVSAGLVTGCNSKKAEPAVEEHQHAAGDSTHHEHMPADSAKTAFACPMHPEITGAENDMCSKCGMKLEAVAENHDH